MNHTTHLELHSQTTRLVEDASYAANHVSTTGFSPSMTTSFMVLEDTSHADNTSVGYTWRTRWALHWHIELFPLHSPLLGESLLVSCPPLINMLKFRGFSHFISDHSEVDHWCIFYTYTQWWQCGTMQGITYLTYSHTPWYDQRWHRKRATHRHQSTVTWEEFTSKMRAHLVTSREWAMVAHSYHSRWSSIFQWTNHRVYDRTINRQSSHTHRHESLNRLNTDTERGVPIDENGRQLRSKIRWFTEFCNSHYLSHFAAFFIDARAKISIAKSCIWIINHVCFYTCNDLNDVHVNLQINGSGW